MNVKKGRFMHGVAHGVPQSISQHPHRTGGAERAFRTLAALTLALLASQFLAGMVVNLFVQVPTSHPGTNAANYFVGVVQGIAWAVTHGAVALQIHVIIGLSLFLASLALLALAIAARRRACIIAAVFGWLGIMGAAFNGASFINYGHDFSSLFMATGFLIAVISYALGYYQTR
jgi:hypothetical protein